MPRRHGQAPQTEEQFTELAKRLGSKALARGVLDLLREPCVAAMDAYCGTSEDIEVLCDWRGAPGLLTDALYRAGYINVAEGKELPETHYELHEFIDPYVVERVCQNCQEPFFAQRADAKTCSPRCRQAAHRRAIQTNNRQEGTL